MNRLPKLKFPAIRLRAKRDGDRTLVWDMQRGEWLVLTPEEWVRRHVLNYLVAHRGVSATSIAQEYPVPLNGMAQRADIVVIGSDGRPQLLVECKAADVKIDRSVFEQAARYNSVIGARYIILTNGLNTLCFELCEDKYINLAHFPEL